MLWITVNKWFEEGHIITFFTSRSRRTSHRGNGDMVEEKRFSVSWFIDGEAKRRELSLDR
jgi:hypothetical protein